MKKQDESLECNKCQEEITKEEILRGETLHYGKTDYHVGCYVDYLREKGAIPMKKTA